MVAQQSTTGQEQILSESIKNLVKQKSGECGSQMRFTGLYGGNPISVTVGKAPNYQETMPITYDFMAQLQKKLGCSEKKLLMIAQEFKMKGMTFESHIREHLEQLSHSLDDFYTAETLEFEEKKEKSLQGQIGFW